ncbi:MAG: hypothetical protein Q9195_004738 [Heterodermia aff. obscurata]
MKRKLELEELNPDGCCRPIYWRERPIHSFAKPAILRKLARDSTLTHWGVQIGEDYVWELEVQDGKVAHHVGVWEVPQKDGVPFVGTENDGDPSVAESSRGLKIGETSMTDYEIRAQAEQVAQSMNRREGRSPVDKILQFYSPTRPLRDLQRLSPKWRREYAYDEAINNCQDFAKRLVKSIQTTNETREGETASQALPTFQERPTAKKKGRLLRLAYYSSQVVPTLPH